MARKNTNEEVFRELTEGGYFRDVTTTPGNTTNDAATTAGDTVISVADETNFATDDYARFGTGGDLEVVEIQSVAVGSITLKRETVKDHAIGHAFVEQEKVDMGAISEGGVTVEETEETTEINASTQTDVYLEITTKVTQQISWNLLNFSKENLVVTHGIPESDISAGGVARFLADLFNTLTNISLYFVGRLEDLTVIEGWAFNAKMDVNKSINFAKPSADGHPLVARVQGWIIF